MKHSRRIVHHLATIERQTVLVPPKSQQYSPTTPTGYCRVCGRTVKLRRDGSLTAHNHCPGAPASAARGSRKYNRQCIGCGEMSTKECTCEEGPNWGKPL